MVLSAAPAGTEEIADWIENVALAIGSGALATQRLMTLASDWAGVSAVQVNMALSVMERREKLLGSRYPFKISEIAVQKIDFDESLIYKSLLFLSRSSTSTPWNSGAIPSAHTDLFEELSAVALKVMLGEGSKALQFGWPSKDGRPSEFYEAVPWLANQMGVAIGAGYRPPRRKDGGVDLVAWRPFKDGKNGFPIYLVQCTVQQDFVSKSRDIDLRLWAGWLALDRDPICVLTIPRTVQSNEDWNEVSANVILLDRIRLCSLIPILDNAMLNEFVSSQVAWLKGLANG